jgi:membrane-bound lytic murein transglycosylase D
LVGCSARARPPQATVAQAVPIPVVPVATPVGPEVQIAPDPYAGLVADVEREFAEGEREHRAGHPVAARRHFDAAVDMLLAVPGGARSNRLLAVTFEHLLDRISALDVLALREGDGFTESPTQPAAIDELLSAAMFERPSPAATTAETVRALLERTQPAFPIVANERVLSFVELFQGRLFDYMTAGLERGARYLPMIRMVFAEEGLPLELAYVPLVESAFKNTALSRASARGMWQFMAGTGLEHGLAQNWFIDERADPEKATRAAAQYLKTLLAMFDGNWHLALASYNAGPGRIQRAVTRAKTTDYWRITATSRYLPRETREYVPMISAAMIIASNPALFGFEVGSSSPLAYDLVRVPDALDLKIIAEWIGSSAETLRELNPELRRTTTPNGDHDIKVPLGTAATVRKQLETAGPLFVKFNFHTVRRGETVSAIARKYKITQSDLRLANDLTTRSRIRVNQALMIPHRTASGLPSTAAVRTASAAASATVVTTAPTSYRVQRGDTLFSIARRFSTTVEEIKRRNRLRTDRIQIGDRLMLR